MCKYLNALICSIQCPTNILSKICPTQESYISCTSTEHTNNEKSSEQILLNAYNKLGSVKARLKIISTDFKS